MVTRAAAPDLAAKVAFLGSPSAYPEGPRAVEVKETHMSWVFLTDTYAYKLKKPVRTDFLDFSTLAARRLNCSREVWLNRRLAPDVYLGTVALRSDAAGGLMLDGRGSTVDWLVKSRRLPASHTLERAIAAGRAGSADLARLVDRLAPFFADAKHVAIGPAAYRHRFADGIEANRRALSPPAYGMDNNAVDALAASQRALLEVVSAGLAERAREGRIVDGHGDLRPEHIYLDGIPIVMDCIEFNRDLRILDPADELAYLAMECDRLGAPEVDRWLFDAWRAASGDAPPRRLIAFYKSCSATLRAKIALWHLDEPEADNAEKWTARARHYLALAARYAREPDRADG